MGEESSPMRVGSRGGRSLPLVGGPGGESLPGLGVGAKRPTGSRAEPLRVRRAEPCAPRESPQPCKGYSGLYPYDFVNPGAKVLNSVGSGKLSEGFL